MSTSFLTTLDKAPPIFSRESFSEEHQQIRDLVSQFARNEILPRKEEIEAYNPDLVRELLNQAAELGLLSAETPEEYDGMGLDKISGAIISEHLAQSQTASFVVTLGAQAGIGLLPILYFGSEELKKKYASDISNAVKISAYCLTEAGAGSDALNISTNATLTPEGDAYVLNGGKQFITNARFADVFILYAKIDGKDYTGFVVDRDSEGLTVGEEEKKMGLKGSSTASITLENVRVPTENLLGKIGKGHLIAFNILNIGRYKLGAMDLGMSKVALREAIHYAANRKQFGQTILSFHALRRKIARDWVRIYGLDSIVYRTIGEIEAGIQPDYDFSQIADAIENLAVQTSMVKVYGSETLALVADDGIQMLGGYGFTEEYPLASIYRDTRVDRIYEGTNEINRQIITGYVMKETLMEQLPVRELLKLSEPQPEVPEGLKENLTDFGRLGNRFKLTALQIFSDALAFAGQDLRNYHQLAEDLADLLTHVYIFDSVLLRINQLDIEPWHLDMLHLTALDTRDLLYSTGKAVTAFTQGRDADLKSLMSLELCENRYQLQLNLAADLIEHINQRLS